jgi:hypothetical protein
MSLYAALAMTIPSAFQLMLSGTSCPPAPTTSVGLSDCQKVSVVASPILFDKHSSEEKNLSDIGHLRKSATVQFFDMGVAT